jgi:hypothetical protein
MAFPQKFKDLCSPAMVYLVISMVSLAILFLQNIGNSHSYHVGSYSCSVSSTLLVFIIKIIYVLFWTWILNLICKDGHTGISWLLILFPFILLFVVIGLLMLNM